MGEACFESGPRMCGMSVQKFVIGMLFVASVVTVWSLLDAAPWSMIALRAIACAVILQVGYFLVVLALVAREPVKRVRENAPPAKAVADRHAEAAGGQKLSP